MRSVSILGKNGVNISRFYLGRQQKGGEALAVIELDGAVTESVLEELRNIDALALVKQGRL